MEFATWIETKKKEQFTCFDADTFIGRWFMSKKDAIPMDACEFWAKKYPYSGQAFRLDEGSCLSIPKSSWCRSIDGIREWLMHVNPPLGQKPNGFFIYKTDIQRGIDLEAMVKAECLKGSVAAEFISSVQEVTPLEIVVPKKMF